VAGRLLRIATQLWEGDGQIEVALTDEAKRLCNYAPSAKVIGYDSGALVVHTAARRYARAGNYAAREFDEGDAVALYSSTGVPLSDTTGAHDDVYVVSVGDRTIEISQAFEDATGTPIAPAAGNRISYAYYARALGDGPDTQVEQHAWQASGGRSNPLLAGAAPYVRGD
jgi:hypothetical protein